MEALEDGLRSRPTFATYEPARQAVVDWIAFDTHSRLRSALDYLSPMPFEQRWLVAQHQTAA